MDYINKPFTPGEILQKARNLTSLWDLHRLQEWQDQRLSEANLKLWRDEKDQVAAGVAQSFFSPLREIAALAERALTQPDTVAVKHGLKKIIELADQSVRLATELGRRRQVAALEDLELWRIVDETLELLDFQFRKHGIRVYKSQPKAAWVLGERASLVQALAHLCLNAIEAMPDGGEIHVSIKSLSEGVRVSLRDTGPGLPSGKGFGLGLRICQHIVETTHGGQLRLENHAKGGVEALLDLQPARI